MNETSEVLYDILRHANVPRTLTELADASSMDYSDLQRDLDALIACGRIDELGRQLQNEGRYILDLQAEGPDWDLHDLLAGISGVRSITRDADGLMHIESDRDIRREVGLLLAERDYPLLQLRQRGGDLDEIYRRYFEKAGEQHAEYGTGGKVRILRRKKRS